MVIILKDDSSSIMLVPRSVNAWLAILLVKCARLCIKDACFERDQKHILRRLSGKCSVFVQRTKIIFSFLSCQEAKRFPFVAEGSSLLATFS